MDQVKEDLENIKSKVLEQIKNQYPEEQAREFENKINSMNEDQFVAFLKQQGILKEDGSPAQDSQCIFCSMVNGQIPTTNIAENEDAIAILELNPISQGHSLIIPREHLESEDLLSATTKDLANQVAEQLRKAFIAQRVDQIPANVMGHQVINLLPVFSNETMESPRTKQTPEGLAKLKEHFENSKPQQIEETVEEQEELEEDEIEQISEKDMILPKRIP
jgi:hypothetical protein